MTSANSEVSVYPSGLLWRELIQEKYGNNVATQQYYPQTVVIWLVSIEWGVF